MSDLPPPPVPADLDLSSLDYMPLFVKRLKRSRAWVLAKRRPEIGFYMLNVWMRAWEEKPCGSLTNDDIEHCDAALCAPDRWPEVRVDVMRGFVEHSDGRLYHPVITEQALLAAEKRTKWRDKKRRQRNVPVDREFQTPMFDEGSVPGDTQGTMASVPADVPRETPLRDGTVRDGNNTEDKSSVCGRADRAPAPQAKFPIRMTESWRLPDEYRAWAMETRPKLNPDIVAIGFRAHHDGKEKLDWFAPWRKWVINEIEKPHNIAAAPTTRATENAEERKSTQARYLRRGVPGVPKALAVELVREGAVSVAEAADYYRDRPEDFARLVGVAPEVSHETRDTPPASDGHPEAMFEMQGGAEDAGQSVGADVPRGVHAPMAPEAEGDQPSNRCDGRPQPIVTAVRDPDDDLLDIPAFLDARRRSAA